MDALANGRPVDPDSLLADALALLGAGGVVSGTDMAPYLVDTRNTYRGSALAVLRPASTEEVSKVVRLCARAGVSIVPQGGNTSLCGGSVPRERAADGRPCVILSLSRMNCILSLDPMRYSVTAQAGCILQTIQEAAENADRLLSMDWGARGSATVGGAISTNGGGMNVLRYGNTREQVLGLEVVLADGTVWDGLRALRKDTSGYDLKQMFIGGEGTLGIVTAATLRLHVRPTHSQSMLLVLPSLSDVPRLFEMAREACGNELQSFELLDGPMLARAARARTGFRLPVPEGRDWYVLLAAAGRTPVADKLEHLYETGSARGMIGDAILTGSSAQEWDLWTLRDEMAPFRHIRGQMLKWDASVPTDVIPDFIARVADVMKAIDDRALLVSFGHVGDGNLHTSIWFEGIFDPSEVAEPARRILSAVDEIVWSVSGSICAEHGVGIEMVNRLGRQKSAVELGLMRAVKGMLDPNGLFNPGVGLG